jgi:hypothetical protein
MDRSNYIGGSDAAALMSDNKFKTVLSVWERLRGKEQPPFESQHIDRGNRLEPIIEEWIKENVEPDLNSDAMYALYDAEDDGSGQILLQHPEDSRLAGHPDGIGSGDAFTADHVLWEIKAPSSRSVDNIRKYGLPSRYKWQVQWYMHLANQIHSIMRSVICVWDCDQWGNPIQISIPYNPDKGQELEERAKNVLFAAEVGQKPAAPTFDKSETEREGDEEMTRMLREYREVKSTEKALKEERKRLKSAILTRADGAEVVQTEDSLARITYDWGQYDATRLSVTDR